MGILNLLKNLDIMLTNILQPLMFKLPEPFRNKIWITPSNCWHWVGAQNGDGYGCFQGWNKAHRLSYTWLVAPIPPGLQIDHICRNKLCCNPAHLEAVTTKENVLRGVGITAQNARKTHCSKGHPLLGENLIIESRGRGCRECGRNYSRNYQRRRRESIKNKGDK